MLDWLSEEEVRGLTKRVRPSAQLRQLKAMGFEHLVRLRTDGTFVVMRDDQAQTKEKAKLYKLDFSELGNGSKAA